MSYQYEIKLSPNYTPKNQVRAYYGRDRVVSLGAGHWWGDPNAGYSHDGVVNGFLNSARQVAAHDVVSAGRVTHMVDYENAAWCTSAANPYTIAIEVDPRIYQGGATAASIRQTLVEHLADNVIPKYGNLEWRAHKTLVGGTDCNPLDWVGIRNDAWSLYQSRQTPEWQKNLRDVPAQKLTVLPAQTPIYDLRNMAVIKYLGQGTVVDIAKETTVGGKVYLISSYSATNGMPNGIYRPDMGVPETPPTSEKPEWLQNWKDIADQDMYTRVDAQLVNLMDGSTIKTIARNTVVRISSTTEWHGKKYALTQYATDNQQPNGLLIDDLDMKPQTDTPIPTKPEPTPQPSGIVYTRYEKPIRTVATKDQTVLWDFNATAYADFKEVDQFAKGHEIIVVGDATHPLNGSHYAMTDFSFGQADVTGTPHKTWGFNVADLQEIAVVEPEAPTENIPAPVIPTPEQPPQGNEEQPQQPATPEPDTIDDPAPKPGEAAATWLERVFNWIQEQLAKLKGKQ